MAQKNPKSDIADILAYLRKSINCNQEALAQKIGIKRDTYAQYERHTYPPISVIRKLCEIYNISSDVILALKPLPESDSTHKSGQPRLAQPVVYIANQEKTLERLDKDETILVNYFRMLPEDKKEWYIEQITKDADIE